MAEEDIIRTLFYLLRQAEENFNLENHLDHLSASDWDELLGTSSRLGVAPLLYDRIKGKSYVSQVPVAILDLLKLAYYENAAKNLIVRKQLEEILFILEAQQVPVMLLKGGALAFTVYDNPACRVMSDLDILVNESDIPIVLTSLVQAGYQMSKPAWETPGHHLPPLVKQGVYLPVEVHWLLANPNKARNLSFEAVWNATETIAFSDRKFLSLSPTLFLFYIAEHASYHHRFINGVQALCDIDGLAKYYRDELSLSSFLDFSESTGCTKGTLLVLKLSEELLNAELPFEFSEYISRLDFPAPVLKSAHHAMVTIEELPDTPSKGLYFKLKWLFTKVIRYFDSVKMIYRRSAKRTVTNRSLLDSANQIIRLSLSNFSAARNQLIFKEQNEDVENYRYLRDWLDNP
jgi:hypothetical protein